MIARIPHHLRVYAWTLLMVTPMLAAVVFFLGGATATTLAIIGAVPAQILGLALLVGLPLAVACFLLGLKCAAQLRDEVVWG